MTDREKVIDYLKSEIYRAEQSVNDIWIECVEVKLLRDALALLKEQEEQKRKWLKNIADNQLANAPKDQHEFMSLDDHLRNEHRQGVWEGLQMAYEIISNDGER